MMSMANFVLSGGCQEGIHGCVDEMTPGSKND